MTNKNQTKRIFIFEVLLFFIILGVSFLIQGTAFAQVNLQASAQNLADTIQKIGLSVLTVSTIIGGTMMGFGSPKGTIMVIYSVIGGVIVLVASGIVSTLQSSIN